MTTKSKVKYALTIYAGDVQVTAPTLVTTSEKRTIVRTAVDLAAKDGNIVREAAIHQHIRAGITPQTPYLYTWYILTAWSMLTGDDIKYPLTRVYGKTADVSDIYSVVCQNEVPLRELGELWDIHDKTLISVLSGTSPLDTQQYLAFCDLVATHPSCISVRGKVGTVFAHVIAGMDEPLTTGNPPENFISQTPTEEEPTYVSGGISF